MAAIKRRSYRSLVWLPVMALLIVSFQNCAVDLQKTTPGAASISCSPTTQQLADFTTPQNTYLIPTTTLAGGKMACGACHGQNVNNTAKAVYLIWQGDPTTDPTITKKNYCQAQQMGRMIVDHPLTNTHGGGQYSTSDIQSLYDWAHTNL